MLLEKATEKQPENQYGETTLHYAASARNTVLMAYLIEEQGYFADIQTDAGMTPLMYAVNECGGQDHLKETVEYLIDSGADILIKDDDGMTARDYALKHGDAEIADMLT